MSIEVCIMNGDDLFIWRIVVRRSARKEQNQEEKKGFRKLCLRVHGIGIVWQGTENSLNVLGWSGAQAGCAHVLRFPSEYWQSCEFIVHEISSC